MANADHNHQPDGRHSEDVPGHPEHPAYLPQRLLARPRALQTFDDLLANAPRDAPAAQAAAQRLRDTVEALEELDEFTRSSRLALLGDGDALGWGRQWLHDHLDQIPGNGPPRCGKGPKP